MFLSCTLYIIQFSVETFLYAMPYLCVDAEHAIIKFPPSIFFIGSRLVNLSYTTSIYRVELKVKRKSKFYIKIKAKCGPLDKNGMM